MDYKQKKRWDMFKVWAGAVTLCLAGCASIPSDPAAQGQYYAKEAISAYSSGEEQKGYNHLVTATQRPGGAAALKAQFSQDPKAAANFVRLHSARMDGVNGPWTAQEMSSTLAALSASEALSPEQLGALNKKFADIVQSHNRNGTIHFVANQHGLAVRELQNSVDRKIIFERTLSAYAAQAGGERDIASLWKLAQSGSKDEPLVAAFRAALPTMNIRGSELSLVEEIDPAFAAKRRGEITLTAHLSVKNADRLFTDDLVGYFGSAVKGVRWQLSPSNDDYQIIIERVRNSEKEIPPTSRTVTYAQHQVDIVNALLFMPRGASYQYDVQTGGAELEYGYVIAVEKAGKRIAENVARGKLGGSGIRCENARIVNVFGGVTAANFEANDDMRRTCSSNKAATLDDLRKELLEKIAEQVRAVPAIRAVHQLNI